MSFTRVVMVFKCSKCPGLLLRSQGEKKKHKKNSHKEQEVVKGAGDCDEKEIDSQKPEGDIQDAELGQVDGQEAGSGGQDVLGEALGGGKEDWVGAGLDNQVFGRKEIGGWVEILMT